MRGFLTYLMMLLFVSSHWLADLNPHFHDEAENITAIESSTSNYFVEWDERLETVSAETIASSIFDDCCAIEDQINAASDINCMADCGLVASAYEPYRPYPSVSLTLSADFPADSNSVSNPFRPPIV